MKLIERVLDYVVLAIFVLGTLGAALGWLTPDRTEYAILFGIGTVLWLLVLFYERAYARADKARLDGAAYYTAELVRVRERLAKNSKARRAAGLALLRLTDISNVTRSVGAMLGPGEAMLLREHALDILSLEEDVCATS